MALDLGIFLPTMSGPDERPGDVAAAARHAEGLGLESVWVVDQLVAGGGAPLIDSTIALAAAASVTSRVRLGLGVLIVPLRPVAWVAKLVASLQAVSGDRLILGVGVGGDRHDRSWEAVGVPRRERGRRTDAALAVLPDLIAGRPVDLEGATVQLAPAATVPPIVVGGMSDQALARTARHADGWFTMPVPPAAVAEGHGRLAKLAAEHGRPTPAITASTTVAIDGDPDLPGPDSLVRRLSDPDGIYGMPVEAVPEILDLRRPGRGGRPHRRERARGRAGGGDPCRRRLVPPGRAPGRWRGAAQDRAPDPHLHWLTRVIRRGPSDDHRVGQPGREGRGPRTAVAPSTNGPAARCATAWTAWR